VEITAHLPAAASRMVAFLAAEIVIFTLASLLHHGLLLPGFEHAGDAVAESVIAVVLAMGLIVCIIQPAVARTAARTTQIFALVLSLSGIGAGTALDYGIHAAMLITLLGGLAVTRRAV
jgi:hypothetical protein